jgi:hypothetical protein
LEGLNVGTVPGLSPKKEPMRSRGVAAVLTALVVLVAAGLGANPPAIQWQRTFTGCRAADARWVEVTADQGFIIAGSTVTTGSTPLEGVFAVMLLRLNSQGDSVWVRYFHSTALFTVGHSVRQTPDGGFVVAGLVYDTTTTLDGCFAFLIRTDSLGNELWRQYYGDLVTDGFVVSLTDDGGYVLSGIGAASDSTTMVFKLDSVGQVQWQRRYLPGYFKTEQTVPIEQTSDRGYIVGNRTSLLKLDSLGDVQWQRSYPGAERVWSVRETPDSGFIATGEGAYGTDPVFRDSVKFFLLKTDRHGNQTWLRDLYGGRVRAGRCVELTSDGGYVAAGGTDPLSGLFGLVIRTDSAGTVLWTKKLASRSGAYSVRQLADGGYVVVGRSTDIPPTGQKLTVWRLAADSE